MDLRIFHPDSDPNSHSPQAAHPPAASPDILPRNFKMMDRLNSWTGLLPCRFLEWSGWYNYSVRLRLLGHYRLYQHFKKDYDRHPRDLHAARAYILQYRAHHGIKYFISKAMAFLFSAVTWKEYSPIAEMAAVNRILINDGSGVLQDFLTGADADFADAFRKAEQQITEPSFFTSGDNAPKTTVQAQFLQFNALYNDNRTDLSTTEIKHEFVDNSTQYQNYSNKTFPYHYHEHTNIENKEDRHIENHTHTKADIHFNPPPQPTQGATGKKAGVFSVRQTLIFFDLLSQLGKLEKIEMDTPDKWEAQASLLFAITGTPASSFIEASKDYRYKGIYRWDSQSELTGLITTLTNMAEIFRKSHFRKLYELTDDKIDELNSKKKE